MLNRPELVVEIMSRIPEHAFSERSDMLGGYRCECDRGSWTDMPEYGPVEGCTALHSDILDVLNALDEIMEEEEDDDA